MSPSRWLPAERSTADSSCSSTSPRCSPVHPACTPLPERALLSEPRDVRVVAHWDGNAWTYPDIGLDQPPQVVWGASETGGTVVLVGSEGGSFSGTKGSIQGDYPLASCGKCSG